MYTQEDLQQEVKVLFQMFNEEIINIINFKHELIKLVLKAVDEGIWNLSDSLYFIEETLLPQFKAYEKEDQKYLLSVMSSGSLLTQFEPYYED